MYAQLSSVKISRYLNYVKKKVDILYKAGMPVTGTHLGEIKILQKKGFHFLFRGKKIKLFNVKLV